MYNTPTSAIHECSSAKPERGGRDDGRAAGCGIFGAAVGFCELRVALLELCFCLTLLLFGRKHYGQEDGYHEVLHNRRGWGVMVQGN